MKKRKSKSWSMAYCGMAAALCVALMLLGTIIPIAMFIAPAVASFLIATVCMECGITMAWTAYAAVSLLGLLFVPDKEIALIFTVLLGYYPLVKPRFDRIRPRALQLVCKLLLCNAACLPCTVCCLCWYRRAASRRSCAPPHWQCPCSHWAWATWPLPCTTAHCAIYCCCTS